MTMKKSGQWVCLAMALMFLGVGPALAIPVCGNGVCDITGFPPETLQSCPQDCSPPDDSDGDGVYNTFDNCPNNWNPNQENCDGDSKGDVCDPEDAIYVQSSIQNQTCHIDKDVKFLYYNLEHWQESMEYDSSSCGSPDRWTRVRVDRDSCDIGIPTNHCCWAKIGTVELCNEYLQNNQCH